MRIRILVMVLVSCTIGAVLALGHCAKPELARFLFSLLGTALLSGGACTLNCYIERKHDALMPRTCSRPIPAGLISPTAALLFGTSLVLAGICFLFFRVNGLSALLGFAAVILYLFVYTPAKRLTWVNTSIGAVPGAIPPLIGWASCSGEINEGGWLLFAILFIWQHTHFFPIAWLFKDDYERAGFSMLPVVESTGKKTFLLTIVSAIGLLITSITLCMTGLTGPGYCVCALLGGGLLLIEGIRLANSPSPPQARKLVHLSILYLPMILAAVLFDRFCLPVKTGSPHILSAVWPWT